MRDSDTRRRAAVPAPAGRKVLLATSMFAVFLAGVLACLVIALAYRLDISWEVPVGTVRIVSERTRDVLADTQGTIKVSCFMDRRHVMFRPVARLLKGLREASRSVAGAEIVIEYVDPRWDLTRSAQLAAWRVPENALLFERQRRRIIVTLDDMLANQTQRRLRDGDSVGRSAETGLGVFRGEMVCAAAISRLTQPYGPSVVYWLQGHGEARIDDYDEIRGFSDIVRYMKRDGYSIRTLSLPGLVAVPDDCDVLVIAGAVHALSVEEQQMVDTFLMRGGRLLYLANPDVSSGLEPLLEKWGLLLRPYVACNPKTLTGQDAVMNVFADHVIARSLANSSVVFGRAMCVEAAVDAAKEGGADQPKVTLLVSTDADGWGESHPDVFPRHFDPQSDLRGPVSVAAVIERGGAVSKDVAYKPTRICVFGESDFVMNGALSTRANANRDLFLNAISWLAGIDVGTAPSLGGDATLVTGFARHDWMLFMVLSAAVVPVAYLLFVVLFSLRSQR